MSEAPASRAAIARTMIVIGSGLGLLVVSAVLGLVGVGAAGIATGSGIPHGWDELSQAFSVLNALFSVLALVIVGVTLWVQFNELRMQRAELRMQREAAERSQRDLHRSSEADIRALHLALTKFAIDDPDLADVWPSYGPGISAARRKQFLYANLVLAHLNLIGRVVDRDEEYLGQMLGSAFENPIMREFWDAVRDYRRRYRPVGSPDRDFDDLCEAAFREAADGPPAGL